MLSNLLDPNYELRKNHLILISISPILLSLNDFVSYAYDFAKS